MFRLRAYSSCAIGFHVFLNTRRSLSIEESAEREKERTLREKVLARYRGTNFPELVNIRYGHFAEKEGATRSAASQAYRAVSQDRFFGQNASSGRQGVDWFMLFTGLALFYVSSKMLLQRLSGTSLDGASVPLWTANPETQAKFLLFSLQFDPNNREQIQQAYHSVRQAYPFTDFFQWLRVQHPEYGQGIVFSYEAAVNSLVTIISSGDSWALMNLARGFQNALKKRNTNSAQRIDDFLTDVGALAGAQSPGRYSMLPGYAPPQPPLQPLQLHGDEPMNIQGAIESPPSESHGSVPFQ
ncbi:hypothetical protein C3747_7g302 [Trypanosoma cruzi]|uniref:Uncharacterized protein n=2 Tax=Trypanosoma cruzi TaxID=5693 RepID=Q4DLI5_TRYCC|nr:hypothetical protein, conserved [Trypanosoma cruzi]EAN93389.1 hypothetical protein, conserved [Trypanosoma cruzi]PWV20319.1 hypothetical protein C3747_7g302 [Trypanosoma cruzi]|eukprot:XP_815240.1 hypothetical protein [Trypanosoma cruzi strain CL Brener]